MTAQQQGIRRFAGRGVIVTGGASGIGAATVRRFLAEGAHVAVVDRNGPALDMLASELQAGGAPVRGIVTDVTRVAQVDAMVTEAQAWLPRVDVLINNAGIARPEPFLEIGEESWDRTLDINLKGMFLVGQ